MDIYHAYELGNYVLDITGYHFTVKILLPIFCILTLLACVAMSVFTHYWYPYIDPDGNKRSKTKPEEYVCIDGCHGIAIVTVLITGNKSQLCGDHAQLSAFDNFYKYIFCLYPSLQYVTQLLQ